MSWLCNDLAGMQYIPFDFRHLFTFGCEGNAGSKGYAPRQNFHNYMYATYMLQQIVL